MRQVLFQIPLDRPWSLGPLGEVPGFGFGVVLLAWILVGLWILLERRKETDRPRDASGVWIAIRWFVVALIITFVVPRMGSYLRGNGSEHFRDGVPVFGYGFMLFVGMASAIGLASWRSNREGLSTDLIWDLAFCLFLSGISGGRLFYLIQKREDVFAKIQNLWQAFNAIFNLSEGGLVLYGALLAGAAAFFIFCRVRKIAPRGLLDIITPSIFVGIGFGRIGCFMNGCCYGEVCTRPWSVQFPPGSAAFSSLVQRGVIPVDAAWTPPLHPTQLYSALDGFLIAAITFWYFRHRRRDGECFGIAMMIYPVTRFLIEILRNDEGGQLGTSLTIAQWVSMAVFVVNMGYLIWLSRTPVGCQSLETIPVEHSTRTQTDSRR